MWNPGSAFARQFERRSATTWLTVGFIVSAVDFAALYLAATREGVLRVHQGIGLLNNYGLFSTLLGNAISLYVVKRYYDYVSSIKTSSAVVNAASVKKPLTELKSMIEMDGKYQFLIYLLVIVGAAFWLRNFKQVSGNPVAEWGHLVFDSPDHPLTFWASRFHNLYTWLFIMPFVVHVMVWSTVQLRRAIAAAAADNGALNYDLLHPDRRGGFGFVDKAHITFNLTVALVYIQIAMHMATFSKMKPEHKIVLFVLTLLLLGMNRVFLSHIYTTIRSLRLESLNRMKEKVYEDDKLSFEILKYCYERRISSSSIVNFTVKAGAILVPGIVKYWSVIAKVLSRA